jgi:demethylmenaquinone methyltransferase/2-methoxy-6-polyprenyl-1,4-benzoquinol methylase
MAFTLELLETDHTRLVLEECWRVLHPRGRLGCISLYRPIQPGKMVLGYEWVHRRFPAWIDCRPIQASHYIEAVGYKVIDSSLQGLWGLPVEIVIARK